MHSARVVSGLVVVLFVAGCGSSSGGTAAASATGAGGTAAGTGGAATGGAGGASAGGASAGGASAGGASGGSAGASLGGAAGSGGGTPTFADPYTVLAFDSVRISSNGADPNFQHAVAALDVHDAPFASATLVIDLASTCYPFDNWKTDKPPAGQNWPADCDAFDRNFEFTLDEPKDAMSGPPAIELVRAITPFGGPLHLEIDVTDVWNGLPGKHTLTVRIPTYSDGAGKVSGSNGGWNVTAKIDVVPGAAPRKVLAVTPLLNFSHTKDTVQADVPFTIPPGTTDARIEYRVTGHGGGLAPGNKLYPGCIGPAEEFCKRTHHLFLDGAEGATMQPWRTDCDQLCTIMHSPMFANYCGENPCGAIQSVKAPRANWCPGSLTPPIVFQPTSIATPGMHTFHHVIDGVADGGQWRVSALLIATAQ